MKIPKFNTLDFGVVAISLLPLLSCHYGSCLTVSANMTCRSLICLVMYMLCRKLFISVSCSKYVFCSIGFMMTVAVAFSLITFAIFRHNAIEVGFDNVYAIRHLFNPFSLNNNAWSEVALAFTAFSPMAGMFRYILMLLSVVSTLVTFSRGAYISLFVLLMLMLILSEKKSRIHIVYISLLSMLFVMIFCHKEMLTTLSFDSTYSQRASIDWRLNSIQTSIKRMDNHFIMGYGCGSYTMVSENGELENFSSYAPNLLVMLFVENGLFGLLLSVGVTILFGCRMWKYRTNNYVRGTVCVLCVIVLKEMSQATFLHLKYMCFLIVLLLAYVSSFSRSITERINVKHVVLSVICILFVALDLHLTYNKGRQIPNDIKKEFDMLENKDEFYYSRSPGEKKLENACAREPYDEYVKYIIAESNIKQGHIGDGIAQLSMLCEKYSCNAAFAFSCGNAYCAIGDKEKAIAYWEKGILQFPRLLLCDEYINIGVCDTVLFSRLNDKILGDYPGEKVLKGKEYAKWGFILNRLGNTDEAIKLLRHSVTYSPNLPVPWLILGDKQKYHFLVNGPFPNYKYYDNHEENVTFTLFELIRNVYSIRFATWYADKLVGNAS